MSALEDIIKEMIASDGPLTIDRYMTLCSPIRATAITWRGCRSAGRATSSPRPRCRRSSAS